MNSVADHHLTATSEKLVSEADQFSFSSEAPCSAGCDLLLDKGTSSPAYFFPESFVGPSLDATDNAKLTSNCRFEGQADNQDVLFMSNTHDFLQTNTFPDPSVVPVTAKDLDTKNLYATATVPFFNPYPYDYQPSDIYDTIFLDTTAQTRPPIPSVMSMVGLRRRKNRRSHMAIARKPVASTGTQQHPLSAPVAAAMHPSQGAISSSNGPDLLGMVPPNISSHHVPSISALAPPSFNDNISCPNSGYGMQPANCVPMAPANESALRVNVEYPLNQQKHNAFQVQQFMPHSMNNYAPHMPPMLPSHTNFNWNFPQYLTYPPVPTMFGSQGYSMYNSNFSNAGTSSISTAPSVLASSVSEERAHTRSARKRGRETPTPDLAPYLLAGPSTIPSRSKSKNDKGKMYVCRWDGCNQVLEGNTTKVQYIRHLDKCHGFKCSADPTIVACQWVEPGSVPGTVHRCGEKVQKQSVIKHTAGKHMKLLTTECPLCGSSQARSDNISRHFKSCHEFHVLDDEEQRELWEEHTPQPFEDYLNSVQDRNKKRRKKARKAKNYDDTVNAIRRTE